jgi:hypothetical protein
MTSIQLGSFIVENKVKFTEPQHKIIDNLLRGSKLTVVNKHHQSGGDYAWMHKNNSKPSYAGSVYKAFWNTEYAIKKQTGVDIKFGLHFMVDTNFVGQF